MRIAVSGAGSTGHVSPVLAVVAALRARDVNHQFIYLGRPRGSERQLAAGAGLPYARVFGGKLRRLPGAGLWRNLIHLDYLALNLVDLVLIAIGTIQALWALAQFRPDIIFNKGGVVGLPVGLAARWLGVPMVIHEPDLVPGWGNRWLGRWASAIAVGFPAKQYGALLPIAKLHFTGNPVQPDILAGQAARAQRRLRLDPQRPVLLVVGGSLGATRVNDAIVASLPQLLQQVQVIHVSGYHDYQRLQADTGQILRHHPQLAGDYHLLPLVPARELGDAYAAATIVVSRAGANAIAELAALRKPTILLPNHEAAAHQVANAYWLEKQKAAVVIPDEQPKPLLQAIRELLDSSTRRRQLAKHIASCGQSNASEQIADLVERSARS